MKTIQPVSIWDKGQTKEAVKLNAYAVNVTLGKSAVFYYSLLSEANETLAQGNITMDSENYQLWNDDDVAWSFIAFQLNLTIVGDYVEPVIEEEEPIEEFIEEEKPIVEPVAEEVIEEEKETQE